MIIRKLNEFEILEKNEFLNEIILHTDRTFNSSNLYKNNNWLLSDFYYTNNLNEKIKVVVGSILLKTNDVILANYLKFQKNINDILCQYNININQILFVEFQEYDFFDEKYNNKNSESNSVLFTKMNTIMKIIKDMSIYYNCECILYKPAKNDIKGRRRDDYNKREEFYKMILKNLNYKYYKVKDEFYIKDVPMTEYLENFYIVIL
jgi:hypothetical protein